MTYATLDEWLDEIENFASRGERLYEEFGPCTHNVRAWLETAWRLGGEAERAKAERLEKAMSGLLHAISMRRNLFDRYEEKVKAIQAFDEAEEAASAALKTEGGEG